VGAYKKHGQTSRGNGRGSNRRSTEETRQPQHWRGHRSYKKPMSPAGRILIDVALDVMGVLVLLGGLQRVIPLPSMRPLQIVWILAGVEIILRTSLRQLLACPFTLLARVVRFVRVQLTRRRRPTQARVTEGYTGARVGPEEAGLTEAVPEAAGAGA
jgi:hypothetical protein